MTHTAAHAIIAPLAAPRPRTAGIAMAVGSALAFSASGPMVKPLLESGWSLTTVLTIRMGLAGLVLSPALVRAVRSRPGFLRRHAWALIGFGLIPVAGCQLMYYSALQRMPVAVALLIQYLAPVMLVGYVWMRTRRAPSGLVLAGSAVAIAGLLLVVDIGGARFDALGTLFALGAAVCVVLYFTMSERAGEDLPPLALSAGGLLVGALAAAGLGVSGVVPFAAPTSTVVIGGAELPAVLPLIWVGAVATSLGYALGVMAVPRIGSRLASFIGLSEVLFTLGIAWLLLGESPGAAQALGGALILGGVVLVRRDAETSGIVTLPVDPLPERR